MGGLVHTTIQVAGQFENALDNFYCDVPQVIKLACTETKSKEFLVVANSSVLLLPCFIILLISYTVILVSLQGHLRLSSSKTLSTCSSHLMVVCLFYIPCVFVYLRPLSSSRVDKVASVFYLVVTPTLNPIIYTLRNHEMKEAMRKWRNKCFAASLFC